MRAIRQTDSKGNEKHNGHYTPTTQAEHEDQRIDHTYEDRLDELRTKAMFALGRNPDVSKIVLLSVTITQVGNKGFYWQVPGEFIPVFEPWGRATLIENERIFNGRT